MNTPTIEQVAHLLGEKLTFKAPKETVASPFDLVDEGLDPSERPEAVIVKLGDQGVYAASRPAKNQIVESDTFQGSELRVYSGKVEAMNGRFIQFQFNGETAEARLNPPYQRGWWQSAKFTDVEIYRVKMTYEPDQATDVHRVPTTNHSQNIEAITERVHEIADSHEWCSEFDDLISGLGLPTREVDLVTRVHVDFTGELNNIPSDLNEAMDRELNYIVGSISNIRFDGQATVEIHHTGRADDPDATDFIDESEVEQELENCLNIEVVSVDHFEILETERAN